MHSIQYIKQGVPLAAIIVISALSCPVQAQDAVMQPAPQGRETPLQKFLKQRAAAADARQKQLQKRLPMVPFRKEVTPQMRFARRGVEAALKGAALSEPATPEQTEALMQAIRHRDQMPAFGGGASGGANGGGRSALAVNPINTSERWRPTGPYQVAPPYTPRMGAFPIAGRVNAIAWDPIRPNILYAATANGGLWRATIDYNTSDPQAPKSGLASATIFGVQPLSDNTFPILRTSSVAVHPKTSRIIYVGTGDFDGGSGGGSTGVGVGIMKSVNDGKTWAKIGDRDANGLIFEGNSVSSIVIDPENNKRLIACSGRGTTPGCVWTSDDEGNTWKKAGLVGGGVLPPGDWSRIDYSSLRSDRKRTFYATRINDGVYRSLDNGRTWTKLTVPLAFNAQGVGNLNLKVAASKLPTAPDNVYVMDTSGSVSDGRIFKSTDRGVSWVGINGDYPYQTGSDNNWVASATNTVMATGIVPVDVFDINGEPIGSAPVAREMLAGGSRALSSSLGIGVRVGSAIYGGGLDLGAGLNWQQISLNWLSGGWDIHDDQHAFVQSPDNFTASNAVSRFGAANDGGVYIMEYLASGVDPNQFYDLPSDWGVNYNVDINSSLVIQPLLNADFFLTDDGILRSLASGNNIGFPKLDQKVRPGDTIVPWVSAPEVASSISNQFVWIDGSATCDAKTLIPDFFIDGFGVIQPDETTITPGDYGADSLIVNWDATGETQFAFVDEFVNNGALNRWPWRRLYYTTDNWQTGLDITPDRHLVPPGLDPKVWFLTDKNGAFPNYFFNSAQPKDTATPTAWQGDTKPAYGQKVAMAESFGGGMYFGTNHLWRYDPPGFHPPVGPNVKMCGGLPNQDRGVWRTVGTQAFGGYITAIAVSPLSLSVVYVGTSTGEIWLSGNAYQENNTMPLPGYIAAWTKIAGGGVSNLPARPIQAITVNPAVGGSGDIMVALGGDAGVPRVWRNANAITGTFFTAQSGQGSQSLPDVAVNAIVRDFDDAFNTFFVATDLGVFVTVDGGSTWTNATAPLGLPNGKCVSLKIVTNNPVANEPQQKLLMAATAGRGVWRYNLKDLTQAIEKPILTTIPTFNRIGNQLIVNLAITNSGGPAFNVRLNTAVLEAVVNGVTQQFPTTSIAAGANIPIGTLGKTQTQVVTLRFPGDAPLYPFTSVNFKITGKYTEPPIPPGTEKDFTNGSGYRTRLP